MRYTASYWINRVLHTTTFDNLDEAQQMLDEDSQANTLAPESIVDQDGREYPVFPPPAGPKGES